MRVAVMGGDLCDAGPFTVGEGICPYGDPLEPAQRTPDMSTSCSRSALASSTVNRHLLRGAIGLFAILGAILLLGVLGPVSLVLLPVAAVAWRGCPTCWAVGMMGTLSDRRTNAPTRARR